MKTEKKKMVFLLPAMRMGGAEKIAINFLKRLAVNYEITVALNKIEGELLPFLPENVSVVEDKIWPFKQVLKHDFKHLNFAGLAGDLKYYLRVKLHRDTETNYRYLIGRSPWKLGHFDIAIGYVANVSTQIFSLADRVDAGRKVAWVHGETNELKDDKLFEQIYSKFDTVYCVSQISKKHFCEKYPACSRNAKVFYNPIDKEAILRGSDEALRLPYQRDEFNILSVGRLSPEKGFDMVSQIMQILKGEEYNAKWYIIGDGTEKAKIEEDATNKGVKDDVVLLGTITNPYPYMKYCDLYVQPSYEEGYSTTICEAGILGCAIVGTTSSGGIYEQVEDGVSAILAKPTPEALAAVIGNLIKDLRLRKRLSEEVLKRDFCHEENLDQL